MSGKIEKEQLGPLLTVELSDVAHKTGTMQVNLNADMIDGIHGTQIPLKTTVNITYYVNTSTGNDTNDGLTSGTAFKTIVKAIGLIPQIVNHTITINVAAGTYNEALNVSGFLGKGLIVLTGGSNTTEAANYIIASYSAVENSCKVSITGFTANTTTDHAFKSYTNMYSEIIRCVCTASSASLYGFVASNGGTHYIGGCVVSNKNMAILSNYGALIISDNNTGSANGIGLGALYGGTIVKVITQPTGTTAESQSNGGVIR